ncbi:hypothetical protein [Roseibium sp.]|uniref:hypothetical protein n=1 Tax=Roseibium sp. TaxID=1936156 RepID=UPI0032977962
MPKLPNGFYYVSDIELALKNRILSLESLIAQSPSHAKVKVDRIALLDGVSHYLIRSLLYPNPPGEPPLKGPHGQTHLWYKGSLLTFDDQNKITHDDALVTAHISDFLHLDDEPFLPLSLGGNLRDDADFASFSTMARKDTLCLNLSIWSVLDEPKYKLDNIDEYTLQSGRIHRWDYEFVSAQNAWRKVEPFSGGRLVYSFPLTDRDPAYKRPSEIAKLLEKRFKEMCQPKKTAKSLAHKALAGFNALPENRHGAYTHNQIALAMGYQSGQTNGTLFRAANELFRSYLTDEQRNRLPKPGRR